MTFVSYAQNFEDVLLWRALKHVDKGFYIDIGALYPVVGSVSAAFYERGWRGINVEPNPIYAEILRNARPDETIIEAAIGTSTGTIAFYETPDPGLSTGNEEIANQHQAAGMEVLRTHVKCCPLSEILTLCGNRDVHWLKVDVEGMEKQVIESWHPSPVRPWIVVVESTKPNSPEPNFEAWEPLLIKLDYDFVYFDGLNRFYVSKKQRELRASFGPGPNYFDDYVLSRTVQDAKKISEAQRHTRASEIRTAIIKEYLAKKDSGAFQKFTSPITSLTNNLRASWSAKGKKVKGSGNFQAFKLYKRATTIKLAFENPALSNTLAIEIPLPVSPRQLGQGEDDRRLGLGLQKLEIFSKFGFEQCRTIYFDRPVSADIIKDVVGLSNSEEWGSWSLGDVLILDFCNPLPESFELRLDAFAFGPNIGRTFIAHLFKVQSTESQEDRNLPNSQPNESYKISPFVDEAHKRQSSRHSKSRPNRSPGAKPRLAMITPIPPDQSGIADYVAELVPELSKYYSMSIFTQKPSCTNEAININAEVLNVAEFHRHYHHFDRVLYQFGNSSFHSHMFDLIAKYPGVAVLHDFFLSGSLAHAEFKGNHSKPFTNALLYSHGKKAVLEWQHASKKSDVITKYPANRAVLNAAIGIIVHSQYARTLGETWYGRGTSDKWRVLPQQRKLPSSVDRDAARERLGIPHSEFLVCSFGGLGPTKLNIETFDAWVIAKASKGASRLILAGRNGSVDYEQELKNRIQKNRNVNVTITGTLNNHDYVDYLQAADCAIQLRTMSRGETSRTVLDCMAYGLAVIVNANGSMAELASDCVSLLPDNFSSAELANEIDRQWQDSAVRRLIGTNAKKKIATDHSPDSIAAQYFDAIEAFHQEREDTPEKTVSKLESSQQTNNTFPIIRQKSKFRNSFSLLADESKIFIKFVRKLFDEWIQKGRSKISLLLDGKKRESGERPSSSLSLADQDQDRTARLYIDVTWTARMNHTSGIERVVRKISHAFVFKNSLKGEFETVLCFSIKKAHFNRAAISSDEAIFVDKKKGNEILTFAKNDRVLMLDMSWDCRKIHRKILENAHAAGARIISCLYDTVPIKYSAMCDGGVSVAYTEWLEGALWISDGFVCISKAVANELLELLKAIRFPRPMKVGYWPLGADIKSSATTQTLRKSFNAEQPRFLMVGTIEPRKNHLLVLQAFSELWSNGFGGTLTIIGRRGWSDEHIVLAIEKNKEFGRKLRWLKNANDDKLVESYEANDVVIAASHAEGFGLPIVEGLQHGCQVLASDIPVFREAAGNSASVRYFIPESRQSLMDKVQTTAVVLSVNEINDSPNWIDWNESARRLAEVIIDDKWYQEYLPPEPMTGLSAGIGSTHITRKLSLNETKHRLAIVGPVARLNSGRTLKYTVKVTNESKELFSSRGDSDGSLGIYLGYHIIARDGGMLKFKNPHSTIPFVIPPGDSIYLPVEINSWSLPYNAAFLDMEMVQEGGEWWGQPLRVAIYE